MFIQLNIGGEPCDYIREWWGSEEMDEWWFPKKNQHFNVIGWGTERLGPQPITLKMLVFPRKSHPPWSSVSGWKKLLRLRFVGGLPDPPERVTWWSKAPYRESAWRRWNSKHFEAVGTHRCDAIQLIFEILVEHFRWGYFSWDLIIEDSSWDSSWVEIWA